MSDTWQQTTGPLPTVLTEQQRPGRPLPDAAEAVAQAMAAVQADAELVGAMLKEIRGGRLWAWLTTLKQVQP